MDSFIDQCLVFIGAAVVLVPLFQRLGFGSVLGYLMAGVLVGPQGLRLIRDSESVMHFAELGVVLLLFVIGLEIQPRKLWSMRHRLAGLGVSQVAFCTLIFSLIGVAFGLTPVVALVIGFSLSLSSTAFALQTLTENNQFNTEFGRSSFAILLAQDLLAIPALAVIPMLAAAGAGTSTPVSVLGPLALILVLVVASRFLIRPLFRAVAKTRIRELFTATTLFIVLGVATLMQKVGLSAALGTFLAGVLLADSEYRHELEGDLDPFKSLLMGLFFIAVGMGVNLGLVFAEPLTVLGLAVGYLLVKTLVIYAVGRMGRMNHVNAKAMAVTVAQGGEFAFVIFGIAAGTGLLTDGPIDRLTAVITLSMALSPFLSVFNDKVSAYFKRPGVPAYDEIKDENANIIIAGFGRFGQVVARILRAREIPFVAIDHDSDQIDLIRRMGGKVYYGDASRRDILESAGAAHAKYLILAVDDVEASVKTARTAIEHFPKMKIFARARNRGHAFDLLDLGVRHIKREVFDSSVEFTRDLLIDMGYETERTARLIGKFRRHDEETLLEQHRVRNDDKTFVSVSKQATAQLAQVLSDDVEHFKESPQESSL